MDMSALTPVVDGRIWTLDRPVWFSGVRLCARTTVVRLEDGSLLLHSPAPPTDALAGQLRALGPVRWLVVPNCFHHLGTPAAAAHFSEAQVVGPASALNRNKALRLHMAIQDAQFAEQVPEFEALPLLGVPFSTRRCCSIGQRKRCWAQTSSCARGARDHWTWRCAARVTSCYERVRVPPDVRKKIPDKAAAARSLRAMLERPAQRLIVGHAEVIEAECRERLAQAWRVEGVDL